MLTAKTIACDWGVSGSIDNISITSFIFWPIPPTLPKVLSKETILALTSKSSVIGKRFGFGVEFVVALVDFNSITSPTNQSSGTFLVFLTKSVL